MEPTDKYYKYAFFSAFTTLPGFETSGNFFRDEIRTMFDNYRQSLSSMQSICQSDQCRPNPDDTFLYRPVPYCLFGDFDMAIFSLIDDFSFATKKFKPSSHSAGYKYQINTGIIPIVEVYDEKHTRVHIFKNEAIPDFFSGKEFYPFTGVASIKLNNAMLVGLGQSFIKLYNFFLIAYLDKWVAKLKRQGKKFFYFLNENLGWNEITIYFFGSSLLEMQEFLIRFRQYRLADIEAFVRQLLGKKPHDDISVNGILSIFKTLKEHSLLSKFIRKNGKGKECLESHPVIATSITYGFHIDMIELSRDETALKKKCGFTKKQLKKFKTEYDKMACITTAWNVKPGHEYASDKLIRSSFPKFKSTLNHHTRTGKYTFSFPDNLLSMRQYLDFSYRIEQIDKEKISRHIIKLRSHLHWPSNVRLRKFKSSLHYEYRLTDYKIKPAEIEVIRNQLRIYPIPYIYKGQIENLINNLNDSLADPLMYNYFIGLKAPLINFLNDNFLGSGQEKLAAAKEFKKNVVMEAGSDEDNIEKDIYPDDKMLVEAVDTEAIAAFIVAWNKAYWNRFFHSYYFSEINDFNIEHHGGIQQLLFTYDVIYKLIARRIYGDDSKVPFVNVQVNHYITSSQYFNSINFMHLFRPAIYACECVHEAANHIIPYLILYKKAKEFSFLFNPRADKVEPDKVQEFLDFEKSLYERVDPREKFEVFYLQDHFGVNAMRHIVADYATFLLGYSDPEKMNTSASDHRIDIVRARVFYESHWFLFLIRADLYFRETRDTGAWFFKEDDFMALFIRFNLMFYLFFDFEEKDLLDLNLNYPSIELKAIWDSEKINLIEFTVRLGNALRAEFKAQLLKRGKKNGEGFETLKECIDKLVFDSNWEALKSDKMAYKQAIVSNQKLIFWFHEYFIKGASKHNIIIRNSTNITVDPFPCNISFYELEDDRDIFLDPKGNLFTTSPESRQEVLQRSIQYIKEMWDLSHQLTLKDYQ